MGKTFVPVAPLQSADGTTWRAEDRPCPICESNVHKRIGARGGRAQRDGKGVETAVVRCLNCDLLYTQPVLLPESNPYTKESADEYFRLHNPQTKIATGEWLADTAEKILGSKGSMLELGCGRGELLAGAANRGWSVCGVEMTEEFANIATAKNIEIEYSSIEKCRSLERTYDVILLAAILEHLYEPLETLKQVREALRPGGLVFIDVPNELSLAMKFGNFYMRARRKDWTINLSPTFSPFHVVGYSPSTLRRALEENGFEIHELNVVKWNMEINQGNTLTQKIQNSMFNAVQSVGALLQMGDGITCWAIRK
jgi:2-polyprenyl-3-methyl-5-hydroxy-6-metoxy-1,4-benzoquinol methylase